MGIDHTEEWDAILPAFDADDLSDIIEVDHDERDFVDPQPGIPFEEPDAALADPKLFSNIAASLKRHLDREETLDLFKNPTLKLVSRPDESRDSFRERCRVAAVDAADVDKAKIATRFAARLRKAKRAYRDAVRDADLAAQAAEDQKRDALIGFGLDLLTGRKPSRSRSRTAQNKLARAESKIDDKRADFEDLNAQMEDLAMAAAEEWQTAIDDIEPISVGLESDDIEIMRMRVVWVRTSSD
jgi:hypothetical protein